MTESKQEVNFETFLDKALFHITEARKIFQNQPSPFNLTKETDELYLVIQSRL